MKNTVFIGQKPTMVYVTSVLHILGENKNITLKARGKAISKLVDVSQIIKNKFYPDININKISVGTEKIEKEDKTLNVSSMELELNA